MRQRRVTVNPGLHRACWCGVVVLAAALGSAAVPAQVGKPTAADLDTAPPQFRGELKGEATRPVPVPGKKAPPGSPPPAADPRDLNGIWTIRSRETLPAATGAKSMPPPATATAPARRGFCVPEFTLFTGYPNQIIQTTGRITFIGEENHLIRRVYLDTQHPQNLSASYGGDAVGHWDGDTLVIETIGIKRPPGRDGTGPARIVERVRKIEEGWVLEDSITQFDAEGNASRQRITLNWRSDLLPHLIEDICEDFGEAYGSKYYEAHP
jgi:hypothetical protein